MSGFAFIFILPVVSLVRQARSLSHTKQCAHAGDWLRSPTLCVMAITAQTPPGELFLPFVTKVHRCTRPQRS